MSDLTLDLVGRPVRLNFDDPSAAEAARARYAPFLSRRRPAEHLMLSVADRNPEPRLSLDPVVEPAASGTRVRRRDLVAQILPENTIAVIYRGAAALDSLLRIWLSFRLAQEGGFLMHAAATEGRLFPGKSGAGKSTLGDKVGPQRLLSDELTGLVRRNGRWMLWGTPFWGNFQPGRSNRAEPLRKILFLDRFSPRGAHSIAPGDALVRFMECVLFFADDAKWGKKLLASAADCLRRVPAYLLSYDARTTSYAQLRRRLP